MNKRHVNVVCAINKKDDKYLSVKRSDKGEVGLKWEFPGGKIEPGESMEEAIVREIKEELNCNIRVIKYLGSVYHEYETFNITLNG
ncbi:MAG: NUDIX domain-containing protein [Bacilli bacterium]|nr:NUDIX domain-containing protein [Bacilli bacterium]